MKLESIDDFLNSFNKISLLIVDRFSAISSGTTRISNTLVNFQFSRCGKIHPKMKSTCKKKNSKYILHQPRVSKILKTNSTFHPPPPFSWKRSKMWKISIKQIVFNPSVKSKILSRHDRNSGLNSIPTRMGGRLVPIQLLPQFESNRIPHRGNLLIARQLDFRVAYGRRGTHRASRLRRRSSNQQRGRATKLTPLEHPRGNREQSPFSSVLPLPFNEQTFPYSFEKYFASLLPKGDFFETREDST